MKWWVIGALLGGIAIAAVTTGLVIANTISRPPYNHVLTTVERVDEDEDALRIYHDKVRGVTCYQPYGVTNALSCIPDVWLSPYHNSTSP